ncbi:hypothetical protein ACO0K9_26050 [Undibacterium sp. Ji50W]|uniref:hypothetical protein n=1 Tax=Undibacterium sp. Ji50W TaxID=3413041 RepID=UPI003BEFCFB9
MKIPDYWQRESSDFRRFLAQPHRRRPDATTVANGGGRMLFLLVLALLVALFISIPVDLLLEHWAGIESKLDMSGLQLFFVAVVAAPILEELTFRAGLRSATYCLFVGPSVIALLLLAYKLAMVLAVLSGTIALIDFLYMKWAISKGKNGLRFTRGRTYLRRFPLVFWSYTAAFALMHVNNYSVAGLAGLLVVFAVSSQLMIGMAASYLRLRNGLISAVIFHGLFNFVWIALTLGLLTAFDVS